MGTWPLSLCLAIGLADAAQTRVQVVERPIRFDIRHTHTLAAGPRTSPSGRLTVRLDAPLQGHIIEVATGRPIGPALTHSQRRPAIHINTWAFSPDGRRLATASSEGSDDSVGEVRVWDVASGLLLAIATDVRYPLGRVHALAFSADGGTVVVGCDDISGK